MVEKREAAIAAICSTPLEVLILGGGINGAGVLRDLALRSRNSGQPLRVALVDRGHFSSGTSGRNSQLIHGGLRYLKNLELRLVREALAERATLLRTAAHLVQPLSFLIPMRDLFAAVFYGAGLFLYDWLAGAHRIQRHRHLSWSQLARLEPRMRRFASGASFSDCRVHSARLVLLNIREAVQNGALAANYLSAESWVHLPDGLWRVSLRDKLSGEVHVVHTRSIVNATGAWSREANLRLVRGSHLVLPRLGSSENAISYFGRDGRIIFFIPWGRRHAYTLVGTTDVDHQSGADQVRISPEEVQYLLEVVADVFPDADAPEPICAYSSLRPLLKSHSASATKTSREHRIWADQDGMVHIAGGKYTTYRLMSEEACDLLLRNRWPAVAARHFTESAPILGNTVEVIQSLLRQAPELADRYGLQDAEVCDLIHDYGLETPQLLATLRAGAPRGLTRLETAQIAFAVREEFAQRLTDLLFVSTYWGYERRWTAENLKPFAREMGFHRGWDEAAVAREIDNMLQAADQPFAEAVPAAKSV